MLLRIPGLGVKAVNRILASRRHRRLRLDDVARLTTSIKKLRPFLIASDLSSERMPQLDVLDAVSSRCFVFRDGEIQSATWKEVTEGSCGSLADLLIAPMVPDSDQVWQMEASEDHTEPNEIT